jgi:hypothetical protein
MRYAALTLAVALAGGGAVAESAPRCGLLGQMAVSTWLETLGALSGPTADADPFIARLDRLTALHARLGCDGAALEGAMDCVLEAAGDEPPRALARRCMAESGVAD